MALVIDCVRLIFQPLPLTQLQALYAAGARDVFSPGYIRSMIIARYDILEEQIVREYDEKVVAYNSDPAHELSPWELFLAIAFAAGDLGIEQNIYLSAGICLCRAEVLGNRELLEYYTHRHCFDDDPDIATLSIALAPDDNVAKWISMNGRNGAGPQNISAARGIDPARRVSEHNTTVFSFFMPNNVTFITQRIIDAVQETMESRMTWITESDRQKYCQYAQILANSFDPKLAWDEFHARLALAVGNSTAYEYMRPHLVNPVRSRLYSTVIYDVKYRVENDSSDEYLAISLWMSGTYLASRLPLPQFNFAALLQISDGNKCARDIETIQHLRQHQPKTRIRFTPASKVVYQQAISHNFSHVRFNNKIIRKRHYNV